MKLSGTGHRPDKLGGYTPQATNKLVDVITMYLDSNTPDVIFWGGALGFDQALCRAGLNLKIPCIACIPFEGYEHKWPPMSRVAYKYLLDQCEEVKLITRGTYAKWKMDKRNEFMVDQLDGPDDILLTIYNGDLSGGTFNCIEYAKERQVTIHNLYDTWRRAA